MDYQGQNQVGERVSGFDFERNSNAEFLPPEHNPNQVGQAAISALNSGVEIFDNPEGLPNIEMGNNNFQPMPDMPVMEKAQATPLNQQGVSLENIKTDKELNMSGIKAIDDSINDFHRNNDANAFVEKVFDMTEANLRQSYNREVGKAA